MDKDFDATTKRECSVCFYDLHMSAAGCPCSADKYSCLNHAKQLCSCPWSQKYFLFRLEISELNLLAEALEGKLSSIYKWAKQHLGLALSSSVSKNWLPGSTHTSGQASRAADKSNQKEYLSQHAATPNRTSSTVSRVKAEIKARLLQSALFNKLKAKENNEILSLDAATTGDNSGTSAPNQSSTSNEKKPEDDIGEPQVVSSTAEGNPSFLQVELTSLISSESSSESSSAESEDLSDIALCYN